MFKVASARAKEFNIEGVTWSLTQGVVKNIIPAIASTNAIIAASCCNEAFKIATTSAPYLDNYFMLIGTDGVYSYTFEYERRQDCPVCGGESRSVDVNKEWTLEQFVESLTERQDLYGLLYILYCLVTKCSLISQIKRPSLSTSTPVVPGKKQLYFQAPPQFELQTRPNLEKKLINLVPEDGEITVTSASLPFSLTLQIHYV